jgi:lauroyl/myristoyl acyltransferase
MADGSGTSEVPRSRATMRGLAELFRHDGVFWRRMAYAGAAHFPEWWRRYTPGAFGALFFAALPRIREIVTTNQARMLGVAPGSRAARRAARALFVEYAHCLTDTLESAGKPAREFEHEIVGREHFVNAMARGRGVVFVTAHTGSWEIGGRLAAKDHSVAITMVMAEEPDPAARAYVDGLRRRAGIEVVYASGHDPSTAITLLSRLRAGSLVAIQIDRPPPSRATVIQTRFFDTAWPIPEGPFRLAQATGAVVVPVFLRRTGYRRYAVMVEPAIEVAARRDPNALHEAAQRATAALERFVRAHPNQWFHFLPLP